MEIFFLGTGAGTPSRERNVTAIALQLFAERGAFWLFDCGEGTQHQILETHLKLSKCEKIFITHLHGDHIYGLPGLLTSRSHQGALTELTIYGPPGLKAYIETSLHISQARLNYELHIVEFEEGIIFTDEQFTVEAALLEHRMASYGFRIVEQDKPGRLKAELLQQAGVRPGPIYAEIKAGKDVKLDDGKILKSKDYVDAPQPGRIAVIMGDTRVCASAIKLAQQADLLVHEATFNNELEQLAYDYYHTTAEQAAIIARDCEVDTLIITHISPRFQEQEAVLLLEEARMIHANTYIAHDFAKFEVQKRST